MVVTLSGGVDGGEVSEFLLPYVDAYWGGRF